MNNDDIIGGCGFCEYCGEAMNHNKPQEHKCGVINIVDGDVEFIDGKTYLCLTLSNGHTIKQDVTNSGADWSKFK